MHTMALLLILFSATVFGASSRLIIKNPNHQEIDPKELNRRFDVAHAFFTKEIGQVESPVTISIGTSDCLRTGYNFTLNQVNFCPSGRIENSGLNSIDVFNHEVFHALLCNYNASLCGKKMREDLHEGLADYFSYLLNPDDQFGEDYYKDFPYVRRYKTTWLLGLVQKPHERGNVFVSDFIDAQTKLLDALEYFSTDSNQVLLEEKIEGAPKSHLNRYRLSKTDVMKMEFVFSPETKVESVEWQMQEGVKIERTGLRSFNISIPQDISSTKGMALFIGTHGEVLGRWTYYFGSTGVASTRFSVQ